MPLVVLDRRNFLEQVFPSLNSDTNRCVPFSRTFVFLMFVSDKSSAREEFDEQRSLLDNERSGVLLGLLR